MSNNAKNLPEVKLGQYKGLAVTRHVRPLSEKTIDQEMVHQTRMRSVYHNSTAPAKRGSRVLLDFVGFMDGEEIPDSRMEKVMVVLGDGKLMPAAEDAIYGHTAGETFRFDFTYPEQFRVEELSGKTAQFEIKLHSVAEKTTPELNEEFARAQGYADLAAMREAVRAKKRKIHEDAADRAAGQELLAKAGANLTVDLPEACWTAPPTMRCGCWNSGFPAATSPWKSTARTATPPLPPCGQATVTLPSGTCAPCWPPAPLLKPRTSP